MSDLGLRYGEEFRSDPRALRRRRAIGRARGACPRRSRRAPASIALHPVLFDGALQIFSAGAATVEDRRLADEIAGAFCRILFLRSPGASAACRAERARSATRNSSKAASLSTTKPASRACWWMASARSASPACAARRAGGTRDVIYHVDWERTPHESARARCAAAA